MSEYQCMCAEGFPDTCPCNAPAVPCDDAEQTTQSAQIEALEDAIFEAFAGGARGEGWSVLEGTIPPAEMKARIVQDPALMRHLARIQAAAVRLAKPAFEALEYYGDEDNYNEDAAPTYEDLSPPEGWCGEEFDATTRLDEGKLARQTLSDITMWRGVL